jgi:hypothetical protein
MFYTVIEAFNLFSLKKCSRNPAAWQCHSASLQNIEFYTEFWNGLLLPISLTSYELQMKLQSTVQLDAEHFCSSHAWYDKPFKLHHSAKHASPHLSSR